MANNDEQNEIDTNRRERSCSTNSIMSVSSEPPKDPKRFATMDLSSLVRSAANVDISVFDRARLFNPRKQRSCHKRAEPVSEEHRKKESSKNSREYTKRNRDEISTCRALFIEINAIRNRFKVLIAECNVEVVERFIRTAVLDFEMILRRYLNIGANVKQKFGLPELETFFKEYRENCSKAMLFEHRPSSPNQHKVKLQELQEQFQKLTTDKDTLNSSKDKTNFASSKSRLNQRIVREHLKSNCWDCWKDINTMTVQAEDLQKHCSNLKKQVWDNILANYHHLFGLFFQQRAPLDIQQIERIIEYFSPHSRQLGKWTLSWKPNEKPVPELVTLTDDDDEETIVKASTKPQTPVPSTSLPVEVKSDILPPSVETKKMDLNEASNPKLVENVLIQDKLVSTTQCTPSGQSLSPFTLGLPTVSAATAMLAPQCTPLTSPLYGITAQNGLAPFPPTSLPQLDSTVKPVQNIVKENTEDYPSATQKLRRRGIPPSDDVAAKKAATENVKNETVGVPEPNLLSLLTQSTSLPTTMIPAPVLMNTSSMAPLPFNPLLTAAPGDITPFEALTPSFLRAIEQQRMMAAFLNNAFQKCQK